MGRFFDLESPIMRFLNRVADLLILNLLMIVCCLPIITAGAAFTAMHYVILKMVRGEEGYLVRGFFKSFASNFKQATLIWLLMLLIVAVYVGDALIFVYSGVIFPRALVAVILALGVVMLMVSVYIFPMLARFDNTIKNTIKNSAIFAIANLPKTVLMVVFYAVPVVVVFFSAYSILFVFLFGISLPAYCAAWLYSGIFKKYEPEDNVISDMDFSLQVDEGNGEIDGESE